MTFGAFGMENRRNVFAERHGFGRFGRVRAHDEKGANNEQAQHRN
jgi:hypothetical protein